MAKKKKRRKKKVASIHTLMPGLKDIRFKVDNAKRMQEVQNEQSANAKARMQLLADEGIIKDAPEQYPLARWNGEPCYADLGYVPVGKVLKSTHWAADLEGQVRKVVRIEQGASIFYIDDESGYGTWKVFYRNGSPRVAHSTVPVQDHSTFKFFDIEKENKELQERLVDYEETLKRSKVLKEAPETLRKDRTIRLVGKQKVHTCKTGYYITCNNHKLFCPHGGFEVDYDPEKRYWIARLTSEMQYDITRRKAWAYDDQGEPVGCFYESNVKG